MIRTRRVFSAAVGAVSCLIGISAIAQESVDDAAAVETTADEAIPAPAEAVVDLFDKDTFSTRTIVCPFKGAVEYDPGDVSCGLLEVPENREKARPRTIELHYVKIAAKKPEDWDTEEDGEWVKRDDPIIYLTGGPGVKAQGYVDRLQDHG
ncbi:MAG: hypothetical protein ACX939_08385, partial [Hyphococcus sp.]